MRKQTLSKTGLILFDDSVPCTIRMSRQETTKLLGRELEFDKLDYHLETVHMEITSRCNLDCGYCYNPKDVGELTTDQWKGIIKDCVKLGVFQLVFSGGEPLLRSDLKDLVWFSKENGLSLSMITNGHLIGSTGDEMLRAFAQINISYHENFRGVTEALVRLQSSGVRRGINFIISKTTLPVLPAIVQVCQDFKAELLLLTYKPRFGDLSDVIDGPEVFAYAQFLSRKKHIRVSVDSLLCHSIRTDWCQQKKRFVTIASDGDVLPCPFIRRPMGDASQIPLELLWKGRGEPIACPFARAECQELVSTPTPAIV